MRSINLIIVIAVAAALLIASDEALQTERQAGAAGFSTSGYQLGGSTNSSVRQVRVNALSVRQLPPDKQYIIDLTSKGVVYEFDPTAGRIDFARVVVRTAAGDQAIGSWLEKTFKKKASVGWGSRVMRIGATADIRSLWGPRSPIKKPPSGPSAAFQCDPDICACTGVVDCTDLFGTGLCGDYVECIPEGPGEAHLVCICSRAR